MFSLERGKSYVKCNFQVILQDDYLPEAPRKILRKKPVLEKLVQAEEKKGESSAIEFDDGEGEEEKAAPSLLNKQQGNGKVAFSISSNTTWEQVEAYLGKKGRPFIINSPAGPTKIYGYPGLAVEVLQNGYLGSVYLFQYENALIQSS